MGDINHKTITTPPINQPSRRKMVQCVIGLDKQFFSVQLLIFSYPALFLKYGLGAQKNRLLETVLLSTGNICFG